MPEGSGFLAYAKGPGRQRRENNGGECGSPKNNADRSHDLGILRLKVGHPKVRTTINVPFLPLVPTVADEMRKQHRRAVNLAVIASRMSAFGGKADISGRQSNVCF